MSSVDPPLANCTPCANCGEREGTEKWGDFRHWVLWCEQCVLRKQIEHAEERAAALPGLRARLAEVEGDRPLMTLPVVATPTPTVTVEHGTFDHPERGEVRVCEVVVVGDGGDYSWGIWDDETVADRQADRLDELLSAVIAPPTEIPAPKLSYGEAFRSINAAIAGPGGYCKQLADEPQERWQTRAVMSAISRLEVRGA